MKNKIVMVVSIVLGVIGLLFLFISPIGGIVILALSALAFFGARKTLKNEAAAKEQAEKFRQYAEDLRTRRQEINSKKVPSGKYKKTMTVKLVGVTHECEKNNLRERQNILDDMNDNDTVYIEQYEYAGSPAFLVVDPLTGCDVGNLPQEVADQYQNERIEGYLTGVGSFVRENTDEVIHYAKVKIYIMGDA